MVVRFVLEHHQPFFRLAVNIGLHHNTAGIYFLGLVQIVQFSLTAQGFHADDSNIHQCHIAVFPDIEHIPVVKILRISLGNSRRIVAILYLHFVNSRSKSGMTAMIRPVSINNPELRNRRRTFFRIAEVNLTVSQISQAHGKATFLPKVLQTFGVETVKIFQDFHLRWFLVFHGQRFRFGERCLTAFYFVDTVVLNFVKGFQVNVTYDYNDLGHANFRPFLLCHELYALRS